MVALNCLFFDLPSLMSNDPTWHVWKPFILVSFLGIEVKKLVETSFTSYSKVFSSKVFSSRENSRFKIMRNSTLGGDKDTEEDNCVY